MSYKILVVDDEKDIVEVVKSRLLREGYDVYIAYDGEEAILKVKECDPDILLLDLTMPKLNGFDVLKEVREKYKDRWRPIIIISAKTELDSLKSCYQFEADHYLTKPCSMENIIKGIETMISLIPLRINK
jgi:two-component system response regulator VicR